MPAVAPPPFDPADAWRIPYAATPYDLWTRTNVGEVFAGVVTPLTWSLYRVLAEEVFFSRPERLRLLPRELYRDGRPPSAFRAINGRLFYNTGLVHHVFTDRLGLPSWFWMLSLGGPQDPSGAYLEKKPLRPLRLLRGLPALAAESRRQRQVIAAFERDQRQMRAQAAALRREDLAALPESALVARLGRVLKLAEAPYGQLFDGSGAALNAYGMLAGLCERWCGDRALANDLVTGLATMTTANATITLWRVARAAGGNPAAQAIIRSAPPETVRERLRAKPAAAPVADALDRFFEEFGHRCVDEFELAVPRWSEEPSFVVATLRTYLDAPADADPTAHLARQQRRRRAAEREARRRVQPGPLHSLVPYRWLVFRGVLRQARRLLPMRENPKHHYLLFTAELRRTLLELARRLSAHGLLDSADDLFFLTREELAVAAEAAERDAPAPGLPAIIAARRALYDRYQAWMPPEAVPGDQIEAVEREARATGNGQRATGGEGDAPASRSRAGTGETAEASTGADDATGTRMLRGIAASAGVVTARARVALTPEEGAEIEPGEVLVTSFTDPGWTPLFTVAGAVVMDLGGLLSHGAIVAREYGIPAVVNTRTATRDIRTGQVVTVDGNQGIVRWQT